MAANHGSSFSYWPTMEHHFLEGDPNEKPNFFYHPVFLVNSKEDPPVPDKTKEEAKEFITTFNDDVLKTSIESNTADRLESTEKARPFKCLQCSKCFLLKHHLTTHEKTHMGVRPFICHICDKSFTHKYCLNTHMLLHSNERPYTCTECKKSFTLKHHLISHKRVHKRDKPFVCNQCGKGFPLRKQLKTHEKYHNGQRPFVCDECGDSFAKENHLVMHLRFHGSLNSFACEDCGATFTRKFELVNHEKLHGRQPLSCPVCTKEFLQKRTLLVHMRTHNSPACPICNATFTSAQELSTHQNLEHRPSQQSFEGNPAVFNSSLTKQTRPPVKLKIFFCDVCFKKFSAKHGLTQHKKRQHGMAAKTFSCGICQKSFFQKNHLALHEFQHKSQLTTLN